MSCQAPAKRRNHASRNHGALLMLSALLILVLFGAHMIDILRSGGSVDHMYIALFAATTLGTFGIGLQFYHGLFFVYEDVSALLQDKEHHPSAETAETTA